MPEFAGKHPIRILGLALEPVVQFRTGFSRNSGLFTSLEKRFDLVGFVNPALPKRYDYMTKLLSVYPNRTGWRGRAALNSRAFRRRSEIAEEELQGWSGRYDLLLELQTLFAPGTQGRNRRYAVYTDNIFPLTRRYYPLWAPLSKGEAARWLELEGAVCRNAHVIFAMSEFLRGALVDDYGCEPARVVSVGGGANSVARSIADKRYDGQVALFVGFAFRRKGGEALLGAWDTVRKQLPDAQLWIVGPPAQNQANGQNIRWFGPVTDRTRLAELYQRATVFAMPSVYEAWGHVFLEAMGHGLPCIGARAFAMPEIIDDGVTGRLVPPDDVEALAEALIAVLGDPAVAETMGHRAYAEVVRNRTWDHVAGRMAPWIESAAEPSLLAGRAS